MRFQTPLGSVLSFKRPCFAGGGAVFTSGEPQGRTATEKPTVLIVEDNMILAMEAEDNLIEQGFTVVGIAPSLERALILAELHKPVLAVVDIRLEGKGSGLEVAAKLLETWGTRCVIASAHSRDDKIPGHEISVSGWLTKPYSMNALGAALLKALQERKNT